jgi:hypothetical protein
MTSWDGFNVEIGGSYKVWGHVESDSLALPSTVSGLGFKGQW